MRLVKRVVDFLSHFQVFPFHLGPGIKGSNFNREKREPRERLFNAEALILYSESRTHSRL